MLTARHVLKFSLPLGLHTWLSSRIREHLPLHEEAPGITLNRVTSLYLDTPQWELYRRSVLDPDNRTLIRIRTYNGRPPVFAEVKQRGDGLSVKRRLELTGAVAVQEPWQLIADAAQDVHNPSRSEYQAFLEVCRAASAQLPALRPTLVVRYRRQAFQRTDSDDLRLTLDTHIVNASTADWRLGDTFSAVRFPSAILEIKLHDSMPGWVTELMAAPELTPLPNFCKYVYGVASLRAVADESWPLPEWARAVPSFGKVRHVIRNTE